MLLSFLPVHWLGLLIQCRVVVRAERRASVALALLLGRLFY